MSETVKISREQLENLQKCWEDNRRCRGAGVDAFSAWAEERHPEAAGLTAGLGACSGAELGQFVCESFPPPAAAPWGAALCALAAVLVRRVGTAEARRAAAQAWKAGEE